MKFTPVCIIAFRMSVISSSLHLLFPFLSLLLLHSLSSIKERERKHAGIVGGLRNRKKGVLCVSEGARRTQCGRLDGTHELQGLVCSYFKHTHRDAHTRMVNCSVITVCYLWLQQWLTPDARESAAHFKYLIKSFRMNLMRRRVGVELCLLTNMETYLHTHVVTYTAKEIILSEEEMKRGKEVSNLFIKRGRWKWERRKKGKERLKQPVEKEQREQSDYSAFDSIPLAKSLVLCRV